MDQQECIFCSIVAGSGPAHVVYEDENVVAFLDIRPIKRGHTLVIPRTHAQDLSELPQQLGAQVFSAAQIIARAVRDERIGAEGANIVINDGEAAFQTVPHTHIHVIPRRHGDKMRLAGGLLTRRASALPETAALLRAAINEAAGTQD
ncbi:HIT family protein [Hoyosella subflava]|uniref:HIT domain-containing protein n=1 Tax=Hoyosella subflava (strain DSM 45089 / JCM 17490 / NBRC 109087 / DQS3-9A1) TaxID=443218 RepID=F6EP82_HOYSD|nr:HIT family protein [Hoyosella subflava]AEF41742.1 hypothetical protein AS9A_3300 [Hoyosella subflava DQS3-9A1]